MAKPPSDVPPDELWLKLSESQPFEIFDFPRKGEDGKPIGKVRVHVLRQESHGMAKIMGQAALHKEAKRYGIETLSKEDVESPAIQSALSDLIAQELLAMALHSTTPIPGSEHSDRVTYPRLFYGAEDIRKKLGADEIAVLFSAYLLTQAKFGPFESNLEKGDQDAWIQRLKDGGASYPLVRLPWPQLVELTFLLAERISSLSAILESQRSTLPDSLMSSLEPFCMDTSYFGTQRDGSTPNIGESSAERTTTAVRMAAAERPVGDPSA